MSVSHRVRESLSWSIDFIPLSTAEDITCILCIKLILGQLSINYNELQRNPLKRANTKRNGKYDASPTCSLVAHVTAAHISLAAIRDNAEDDRVSSITRYYLQLKKSLLQITLMIIIIMI